MLAKAQNIKVFFIFTLLLVFHCVERSVVIYFFKMKHACLYIKFSQPWLAICCKGGIDLILLYSIFSSIYAVCQFSITIDDVTSVIWKRCITSWQWGALPLSIYNHGVFSSSFWAWIWCLMLVYLQKYASYDVWTVHFFWSGV